MPGRNLQSVKAGSARCIGVGHQRLDRCNHILIEDREAFARLARSGDGEAEYGPDRQRMYFRMTIPWDIPATLRTIINDSTQLTLRTAVEAFRDLPACEQLDAEILFYFERERGRIGRDAIEKYVDLLGG